MTKRPVGVTGSACFKRPVKRGNANMAKPEGSSTSPITLEELLNLRGPEDTSDDASAGRLREFFLAAVPMFLWEMAERACLFQWSPEELCAIARRAMNLRSLEEMVEERPEPGEPGEASFQPEEEVGEIDAAMCGASNEGAGEALNGVAKAIACMLLVRPEGFIFLGIHWRGDVNHELTETKGRI